jgi:transcriptional regulator with XRE-family HTH domain
MNIGQSIKQLRKERGISQKKFAKETGISQTYLSLVESGKRDCTIHFLEIIAKGLNMPLSVLFWFSIEAKDVLDDKKEHFEFLKPSIDQMIKSLL